MTMTNPIPVFDAHQHFWDTNLNTYPWLCGETIENFRYGDYGAIRTPYMPEDYRRDTQRFRIAGSAYIEAEWNPHDSSGEMAYIAQLREREGLPTVAVGQAWLDRPDLDATLDGLKHHTFVRGVRHKPRANASPGMRTPGGMTVPAWRAGYARLARYGLHFELQTPWWHLREAAALANIFPETRMVLNHTGLPSVRSDVMLAAWREAMEALAQCPNAYVKISGLGQRGAEWTADANRWIVRTTIEMFGVERCMFASNFPVDSLCGTFDQIYDGFLEILSDMNEVDQRRLFHDNAVEFYSAGT